MSDERGERTYRGEKLWRTMSKQQRVDLCKERRTSYAEVHFKRLFHVVINYCVFVFENVHLLIDLNEVLLCV